MKPNQSQESKTCPGDSNEIAGHAEPKMNNKNTETLVNAVEKENIIRKETNEKERKEDPNHVQ